jgi:hypothetical protein
MRLVKGAMQHSFPYFYCPRYRIFKSDFNRIGDKGAIALSKALAIQPYFQKLEVCIHLTSKQ